MAIGATNKFLREAKKGIRSTGISKPGKLAMGYFAADTVMNMRAGDSLATSAIKTSAETMLYATMPGIMGAYGVGSIGYAAVKGYNQWKDSAVDRWQTKHLVGQVGGNYFDTQRAATMRQAAVQEIQGSKLNARSALGGEARILSQNFLRR